MTPCANFLGRKWNLLDLVTAGMFLSVHCLALFAPFYFTWTAFLVAFWLAFLTGFGITLSYHRNLAHRSFRVPKLLEYLFAYCGVLALEGSPIEWVSTHRYHHQFTDTEKDAHSPLKGFWYSHMGWILDSSILYAVGGLPFLVWGVGVRMVVVFHITLFVNSAGHTWGYQTWNTGDLSRNLWWLGLLALGEGWHNNHHAFEYSARQGLEWWQIDLTWYIIKFLEALGLATDVKVPSEAHRKRMALKTE
ncbi:PREDICTED: palmitoyl-monogalactosyldiacylglycerol [Prunus dulcis]|uniref:PREDICTED: palmitoyl-monogalactosyldiacylglycerol n=1 Tax=Prunus dulcis TaxID=3755 RepID=A0A5E4FEC9_PRUDU|nr:PREDICTED: palmitoyl-monogalactosyldiacylglycerol [Prunus dulcis]